MIVRDSTADSDSSPLVLECSDCGLVFDECGKCKRNYGILKTTHDPMASKELRRWMSGELRAPEQSLDALRAYVETQNIARFRVLLETEMLSHERKGLIQLLAAEEAKHAKTIKT